MPDPRPDWVLARRRALGHRIALWRASRGWTVEDLAHTAGVHRSSVIRAENAQRSTGIDVLFQLAAALDVSVETMIGQDPPRLTP